MKILSLLSPSWIHPAFIGAISAACLHDHVSSSDVLREAQYKLNGLKTAVQAYCKLRRKVEGDNECTEGAMLEEVTCTLMRLCMARESFLDGEVMELEIGLSRLPLREDVRVTLLDWIKSEMELLLESHDVADLFLSLMKQTFCGSFHTVTAEPSSTTHSVVTVGQNVSASPAFQAVLLSMANVFSARFFPFIATENEVPIAGHFDNINHGFLCVTCIPLLLQSISTALSPHADSSYVSTDGASSGNMYSSFDHQDNLVKKVI